MLLQCFSLPAKTSCQHTTSVCVVKWVSTCTMTRPRSCWFVLFLRVSFCQKQYFWTSHKTDGKTMYRQVDCTKLKACKFSERHFVTTIWLIESLLQADSVHGVHGHHGQCTCTPLTLYNLPACILSYHLFRDLFKLLLLTKQYHKNTWAGMKVVQSLQMPV